MTLIFSIDLVLKYLYLTVFLGLSQFTSDPAISGMNISVNEIVMTPESKLKTIRSHLNNDLLTLRDFGMNWWPNDEELGYYNGIPLKCDRVIIPSYLVPDVVYIHQMLYIYIKVI